MSEGKKALLMCILAFVLGCVVVASSGCRNKSTWLRAGAGVRVDGHGAGIGAGVEIAP